MTLSEANIFNENNDNTIYTINSGANGQYCTIIPKNVDGNMSMLVDINMKAEFDSLIANSITKEALIDKLNKEYDNIKNNYPTGILVIPMTDINNLTNAINNNDKQKIFDETKKIGGITSELYKKLTESGIDKSRINQKIMIVEKNDIDTKFVDWLKEQMPNFVDGIKLENNEHVATENNPFSSTNPFTGEESNVETPTTEPQPEIPTTNDLVATPTEETVPVAPVEETPTESVPSPTNNDVFGTPTETTPVTPEPVVAPTPEIAEPQPIQSTPIDSTSVANTESNDTVITPNPIPEQKNPEQVGNVEKNIDKKSGGFANLLILLVVLAVVTVASIELGKFLFNTFGA